MAGGKRKLSKGQTASVIYHDLFDYPLTKSELEKWKFKGDLGFKSYDLRKTREFYHLRGREKLVGERIKKESYSRKKLKIARRAAALLDKLPTVRFVGITGSLAMMSANKKSDIDLIIITKNGTMWTTRLAVHGILLLAGFVVRTYSKPEKKDALCLNIFMDESDLRIKNFKLKIKNLYMAHELAQIIPLVNKNKTYERLIASNLWITEYWPNAVEAKKVKDLPTINFPKMWIMWIMWIERLAYTIQYAYMRRKITRETVTKTRAFFHPVDWGREVERRLGK